MTKYDWLKFIMKKYKWLIGVSDDCDGDGSILYVTFDPCKEGKLGIKHIHDEYGDIEYFTVDNSVLVTIYEYGVLLVESEKEEDVNKVLEYIDKAVS